MFQMIKMVINEIEMVDVVREEQRTWIFLKKNDEKLEKIIWNDAEVIF